MKKIIIAAFIISALYNCPLVFGASWYVDNSVGASGNGQGWGTAWKNFSNINWASVSCGDTIYLSGGATGKTKEYAEKFIVGKSCTSGSPLNITVGVEASHNGTVQLVGEPGGNSPIIISDKNYITIDGQSNNDGIRHIEIYQKAPCTNCAIKAVQVIGTSVGTKLKYLYIHHTYYQDDYAAITFSLSGPAYLTGHEVSYNNLEHVAGGVQVYYSGGLKPTGFGGVQIHHNTIKHFGGSIGGVGGLGGYDIYNNTFSREPDIGYGYPDGIHAQGSYVRVFNNFFSGYINYDDHGNAAVYWEPDGGGLPAQDYNEHQPCCFRVYNNVFSETTSPSAYAPSFVAISLGISDDRFTSVSDVQIINNTFNGQYNKTISLVFNATNILERRAVTNINILNNVFYNSVKNNAYTLLFTRPAYVTTPVDYGGYGSAASIVVDYNSYYQDASAKIMYLGKEYSYADFLSACNCQALGVTADPMINVSLTLQASSPCINAIPTGSAPTHLFTTDYAGTIRPQGSAWDIGAYEYIPSPASPANVRLY